VSRKTRGEFGRRGEDRTPDPGLVRAVLSQLSYPPIVGISETCMKDSIASELIPPEIVPGRADAAPAA
jgi:hypothetical protein